jgi:hypothetical protein
VFEWEKGISILSRGVPGFSLVEIRKCGLPEKVLKKVRIEGKSVTPGRSPR